MPLARPFRMRAERDNASRTRMRYGAGLSVEMPLDPKRVATCPSPTRAPPQSYPRYLKFTHVDSQCAVRTVTFLALLEPASRVMLAVSAFGGLHVIVFALPRAKTHVVRTRRMLPLVVHADALVMCRER